MSLCLLVRSFMAFVLLIPFVKQALRIAGFVLLAALSGRLVIGIRVSSWYGYLLFLVYVGGLLVLFAYIRALSPNVLFKKTNTWIIRLTGVLFWYVFYFPHLDPSGTVGYWEGQVDYHAGSELGSSHFQSVYVGLAFLLLLRLVVVVKICCTQMGALRRFQHLYACTISEIFPLAKSGK